MVSDASVTQSRPPGSLLWTQSDRGPAISGPMIPIAAASVPKINATLAGF